MIASKADTSYDDEEIAHSLRLCQALVSDKITPLKQRGVPPLASIQKWTATHDNIASTQPSANGILAYRTNSASTNTAINNTNTATNNDSAPTQPIEIMSSSQQMATDTNAAIDNNENDTFLDDIELD